MKTIKWLIFALYCGYTTSAFAFSVEDAIRCQTKASILAGAADARDRNFPADVYIKSQLQTRLKGADDESIKVLNELVRVAYETYQYDSPEQLRYSFNKWCMTNVRKSK